MTHATPGPRTPAEALDVLAPALLRSTAAAVLVVRPGGRLVTANPAAALLLGDAAAGDEVLVLLAGARGLRGLQAAVEQVARRGSPRTHVSASGPQTLAWSLSSVPDHDELVAMVGLDISTTTRQLDALHAQAHTDALTGLANRSGLDQALQARAGTGAPLLFCDLNGFKEVNDTHGHAAGDQVLIEVARRFVRAVRGEDLVARLGGDEFVVLGAPSPSADGAGLRRRIVGAVQQPMILPGGLVVRVGVAVGLAELTRGVDPLDALRRADAAMYDGKPTRRSTAGVVPGPA